MKSLTSQLRYNIIIKITFDCGSHYFVKKIYLAFHIKYIIKPSDLDGRCSIYAFESFKIVIDLVNIFDILTMNKGICVQ